MLKSVQYAAHMMFDTKAPPKAQTLISSTVEHEQMKLCPRGA